MDSPLTCQIATRGNWSSHNAHQPGSGNHAAEFQRVLDFEAGRPGRQFVSLRPSGRTRGNFSELFNSHISRNQNEVRDQRSATC
jgi:hypothetical protein